MSDEKSIRRGHRFKDITGQKFNRLTAIRVDHMNRCAFWLCSCECGNEVVVPVDGLTTGHTKSCGCHKVDEHRAREFKHGCEPRDVFNTWCHMRRRCYDPKNGSYKRYGGRGITICERWLDSFIAFRDDMGPKPSPAHSIDRIDNDGNYEPGNCRWATNKEQARNRRSSRIVEHDGQRKTIAEWAEIYGLKQHFLWWQLVTLNRSLESVITREHRTAVSQRQFWQ